MAITMYRVMCVQCNGEHFDDYDRWVRTHRVENGHVRCPARAAIAKATEG